MKKIVFLIFGLLTAGLSHAATAAQSLQNLLNGINSMTADFNQVLHGNGGRIQKSSGTLVLKKPGLFRWNVTKPSTVTMVSNGKVIWMYDKSLAQVSIMAVNKNQGSSPAMVLSNRIQLLSNYFIVWQKNGWYYLNPRYKDDMVRQVQLKFQGRKLQGMHILDNLGQHLDLGFTHVTINKNLNPGQFNFVIPKGVDVIKN